MGRICLWAPGAFGLCAFYADYQKGCPAPAQGAEREKRAKQELRTEIRHWTFRELKWKNRTR